jgi:hypothetical protein
MVRYLATGQKISGVAFIATRPRHLVLHQSDINTPDRASVENGRAFVQKSITIITYLSSESKVLLEIQTDQNRSSHLYFWGHLWYNDINLTHEETIAHQ